MKNLILTLLFVSCTAFAKNGNSPITNPVIDPNVPTFGTWANCSITGPIDSLTGLPVFQDDNTLGGRVYNIYSFLDQRGQIQDREEYVVVSKVKTIEGLLEVRVEFNSVDNGSVRIIATDLQTRETEEAIGNINFRPTRHGQIFIHTLKLTSPNVNGTVVSCTRS